MTITQVSRCDVCDNMFWGEDFDYELHTCVACAEHLNPEGEDA